MKHTTRLTILVALVATAGASSALAVNAKPTARKTETLRFFAKDVSVTVTQTDGTVIRKPPYPEPKPGDILDVNAVDYVGNHKHHARRWSASHHAHCVATADAPDCESQVAIGGSLLMFDGFPGTLVNGTGRYQGATGRVVSNKDVPGGSDIVARIRLAR
jgi:hypothetical protein